MLDKMQPLARLWYRRPAFIGGAVLAIGLVAMVSAVLLGGASAMHEREQEEEEELG